jgi:hypothetical protein
MRQMNDPPIVAEVGLYNSIWIIEILTEEIRDRGFVVALGVETSWKFFEFLIAPLDLDVV